MNFQIGNIVQLNSGGPEMTVQTMPRTSDARFYTCQWFAGKKLESGRFAFESLKPVEPKVK